MTGLSPQLPTSGYIPPSRIKLSMEAEQLLKDHLDDPLTIREICAEMGVPSRTLHVAFLDCFGVPPKKYLKLLRLHAAHNGLRSPTPLTTVTGVAMRWSFYHLSRFSKDYSKTFGERPSTTLRRHKSLLIGATACSELRVC